MSRRPGVLPRADQRGVVRGRWAVPPQRSEGRSTGASGVARCPAEGVAAASRVVSLVPSLTEASRRASRALVGATDWCTHPADLDVPGSGGPRTPNWRRSSPSRPDLVIANREENRELDVRRLRDAGVAVWVTVIETVPAGDDRSPALHRGARLGVPDWLEAAAEWAGPAPEPPLDVAVPIWRDPWMVVGRDTFTGDVLARLGWTTCSPAPADRYPQVERRHRGGGRRPGAAAGRALPLHRGGRPGGVPVPDRARPGPPAHLVRPSDGRGQGRADRGGRIRPLSRRRRGSRLRRHTLHGEE